MSYFKFYYYLSAVIGALQIIDGVVLVSSANIGAVSLIFSLVEMLWVVFSAVAIFKVQIMKYVPISYVTYNIAGWVYGGYVASNTENLKLTSVPVWVAIFGFCFGVYFLSSSVLAIKHGAKTS